MESIGVRELRQNASKYLDRVKRGETIQVTERGVPIAVLGPVPAESKSRFDELVDAGLVTPATGNLQEWLVQHPPTPVAGPTLSEAVDDLREERG